MMKQRILLIFAVLLCLSLLLVACGPDNNGGGTEPPEPTEPVALDAPDDIKASAGVLTFSWNSNAGGYNVRIDGTKHNVTNQTELNALTFTLDAGIHTVAVQAVGKSAADLDSAWSSDITVFVDDAPAGLEFVKITDNYYIRWNGTSMVVRRFEVTVDTQEGGQWVAGQPFFVEDTAFTVDNLAQNYYRVRVRSYDDGVQFLASPYSQEFFYTVDASGVVATANADSTGAVIWGAAGDFADCTIPEKINIGETSLPVTEIVAEAFANNAVFAGITIPESVATIGKDAFLACTKLVVKPLSATPYAEAGLFADVRAIFVADELLDPYKAALPTAATKIYANSAVTSDGLLISDGVLREYFGSGSTVVVPDSVKSITKGVFSDANWIENVTLPFVGAKLNGTSDTNFGYIFGGSNSLVPASVKNVTITGGKGIFDGAFSNCVTLTSVTIPDTVTRIGIAFDGCSSLESLTLPFVGENESAIEEENSFFPFIFGADKDSQDVKVPPSLKTVVITNDKRLERDAFAYCKWIENITLPQNLTYIGPTAFYYCSALGNVTIPSGVEEIRELAFLFCERITSFHIPKSVKKIGNVALRTGGELISLTVETGNAVYHSEGNCIIETASNTLVVGSNNGVIPDYVTRIGDGAFSNCLNLSSIDIPDGVTYIGEDAFSNCARLTTLILPDSLTTIRDHSFSGSGLVEIVIPDSVTRIPDSAFFSCMELRSITIPEGVATIGSEAFFQCVELVELTIPSTVTRLGADLFELCHELKTIRYAGTEAQWNAISKGDNSVPTGVTVVFEK
jgi:hypothetical protein